MLSQCTHLAVEYAYMLIWDVWRQVHGCAFYWPHLDCYDKLLHKMVGESMASALYEGSRYYTGPSVLPRPSIIAVKWALSSRCSSLVNGGVSRSRLQYGGMITPFTCIYIQSHSAGPGFLWFLENKTLTVLADDWYQRPYVWCRVGLDAGHHVTAPSPATSEYTAKCFCLMSVSLNIWLTRSKDHVVSTSVWLVT